MTDLVLTTTKMWYCSKTIWTNIIAFLILVLQMTAFNTLLPATFIPWEALLITVLNLVLRSITQGSVQLTGARSPPASPPQS